MDEITTEKEQLRKDEQMQREAESTRQRLAKELAEYLERRDSFDSVDELQSTTRKIAEIEGLMAENITTMDAITTRIKNRKAKISEIITSRFEHGERPTLTAKVLSGRDTFKELAQRQLVELEKIYVGMVVENDRLQSRSEDLMGRRERQADRAVNEIADLLRHLQQIWGVVQRR